jgi:sodium-independent sulfate anion transporter 11
LQDRPWNDPGPRRGQKASEDVALRPILRAVILDFSAVNHVDVTSVQALIDLKNQFAKHAAPSPVEWHFASVGNRWTRRALVAAGFGFEDVPHPAVSGNITSSSSHASDIDVKDQVDGGADSDGPKRAGQAAPSWTPLFSVSPVESPEGVTALERRDDPQDPEKNAAAAATPSPGNHAGARTRLAPVYGLNRPFFHVDVSEAVESAILSIQSHA